MALFELASRVPGANRLATASPSPQGPTESGLWKARRLPPCNLHSATCAKTTPTRSVGTPIAFYNPEFSRQLDDAFDPQTELQTG